MREFFTLLATALMLPASAIAQALPFAEPLAPQNRLALNPHSSLTAPIAPPKAPQASPDQKPSSISINSIDTSDWTEAEGDWQYYSNLAGLSFPTKVKYKYLTNDKGTATTALLSLTNDDMGTWYLKTNLVTGDTSSHFETDENGNVTYPNLGGAGTTLITGTIDTQHSVFGAWGAYPLSGYATLFTTYYTLVDGKPDDSVNNHACGHDYLYNTQAKDCKIKAEYAKGYYKGEKTAKIKLQRGEGVSDVYYVMAILS